MRKLLIVFVSLASFVLIGCDNSGSGSTGPSSDSKHPSALVGTWSRHYVKGSSQDSDSLTLKADGTFDDISIFRDGSYVDQFPGSGVWSVSGDTLSMQQTGRSAGLSKYTVDAVHLRLSALAGLDTLTYTRQN